MHSKAGTRSSTTCVRSSAENVTLAIALTLLFPVVLFTFMALTAQPAQGQTYRVIYNFTGGADGAHPMAGLTMDRAGNLYGTTGMGGTGGGGCGIQYNCGTVFQLSPHGSGWTLTTLHGFRGETDGANPQAAVVFGADGALYGTTVWGGVGSGTAYKLALPWGHPPSVMDGWTESVIYRFEPFGGHQNVLLSGDIVFDQAGNIYGTSYGGGRLAAGSAYKLTPTQDGWTETDLHSFGGGRDGAGPFGGVVFDRAGNLYGTTAQGGPQSYGTVFQLTPMGSGWGWNILYYFQNGSDGWYPVGGLLVDQAGNLYGTTSTGASGSGTVFELSPSGDSWTLQVLCDVAGSNWGPMASLTMDTAGNLYGTTYAGGPYQWGSVFKATHSSHGWTCTSLHDFTDGEDGGLSLSKPLLDANGNLYGTTGLGGRYGAGVVWEITP